MIGSILHLAVFSGAFAASVYSLILTISEA